MAAADFLPKINVSGAAAFLEGHEPSQELYYGGVNIELSLYQGGRRVGRLRGQAAEVRGAVAQGQEICNKIALEVQTALLELEDARQRIELARTTLRQATENFRLFVSRYQKGDAIQTDVIEAELTLVRAQQTDATALYDYWISLARLAYALGISLEHLQPLDPGTTAEQTGGVHCATE